jgi:hypothetical protein
MPANDRWSGNSLRLRYTLWNDSPFVVSAKPHSIEALVTIAVGK